VIASLLNIIISAVYWTLGLTALGTVPLSSCPTQRQLFTERGQISAVYQVMTGLKDCLRPTQSLKTYLDMYILSVHVPTK